MLPELEKLSGTVMDILVGVPLSALVEVDSNKALEVIVNAVVDEDSGYALADLSWVFVDSLSDSALLRVTGRVVPSL